MRLRTAASLLSLAAGLSLSGCAATRTGTAAAPPPPAPLAAREIPSQLPRTVRPLQYALSVTPDAANLRFAGSALIDIEVKAPVREIVLNAADLRIAKASLSDMKDGSGPPLAMDASDIGLDADAQTATLRFPSTVAPGRYRLAIDYSGKIYTQAAGLFALDYDSAQGRKRALFTQFEAPDARRFFPGWDEPQFRTPYNLTVTVPADQDVIGNMPQAGVQQRPGGMKTVTFQTTPPMSSYLVFLGVGDFDRITTTAAGTEIGVVTKAGSGENGRWALESAARILPWYNDYFGTPYPLPKLDNVAGAGSSQFFGAMENWGAIFTFESALLVDPAITSAKSRQSIFEVAAHEMAHQWFGDLVTMAWWDDLWLNEGFASWMESKATEAIHPEWEPELGAVSGRETAITLDSVATTHPVVQHLQTVEQISQAFDAITYQKGEAVIRMLEDYVGSDAWRKGVQAYVRAHRLSNTQTDDLWRAVEGAAGKPVTAIAHDFTLQPGVPLIRVEDAACRGGKTMVTLRQAEFSRDRPQKAALAWRVPVIASTLGGAEARTLVAGGTGAVTVPGCGPLIVNSGQTGYYRTLYTPALLEKLTASYARLKPIDQIGLLADNWGLGLAGYQPASEALDLIDAAPADGRSALYARIATILGQVYDYYDGDAAHQAMVARYASAKLAPVLARIGWAPKAGESPTVPVLRAQLIDALGEMGDPGVVGEANRRYAAGDPLATAGPLRSTILSVVAQNIDSAGWDRLRAQARAETNPLVKAQLYRQLASARDPALAQRALELALTDEPGATTSSAIISDVAAAHPDLAFDFAIRNREKVEGLVDSSSRSRFVPRLGAGSADPAMIAKLEDYASRYMTAQSRRPADQAMASIRDRVRVRTERLPDITRWLEAKAR
ncbi:MAG: ERAP1-like C-terminal domain-containing protein [Alphaproteobacteria bacterium]|nr:ERAP1-like C-terminal domain-containing protein [Alphaproteobacteria bacterium]MBV9370647.1 ERAP1-like C-terminal domain-containing protein [Alphaproteobacteria bacterium]MBV9899989.1 ERAP1-like C-terminal domain-containing protein [Alphaproteobacteria bacterium]